MTIEAMKQALEALEKVDGAMPFPVAKQAITSLRQAIAEAEKHEVSQEPVACQHKRYSIDVHEQTGTCYDCGSEGRMRFVVDDTHPQPNVPTNDMKQEHVDETAKQRHEENI